MKINNEVWLIEIISDIKIKYIKSNIYICVCLYNCKPFSYILDHFFQCFSILSFSMSSKNYTCISLQRHIPLSSSTLILIQTIMNYWVCANFSNCCQSIFYNYFLKELKPGQFKDDVLLSYLNLLDYFCLHNYSVDSLKGWIQCL